MLCAAPIVATLVSERILARGRELAILRAGGLTPGGIVMLNGVFYGVLGALGGLLGLIGGTLVAPLVAERSEELLSAPETVGPTATAAIAVVAGHRRPGRSWPPPCRRGCSRAAPPPRRSRARRAADAGVRPGSRIWRARPGSRCPR